MYLGRVIARVVAFEFELLWNGRGFRSLRSNSLGELVEGIGFDSYVTDMRLPFCARRIKEYMDP